MIRLFLSAWISFITILFYLHDVHTQMIHNNPPPSLDIDQGYLTIRNNDSSSSLLVYSNFAICEHCDFLPFASIPKNSNYTQIIDTRYPYNFQFFAIERNQTLQCHINSYRFSEHGSYLLEVIRINQDATSCMIRQTGDSSYYWTPIIVGIILLSSFVLLIQAMHQLYHSEYARHILTNIGHERLINDDNESIRPAIPTNSQRTPSQLDSDIINTIANTTESPLVASTRSSNNSVRISRVLPKRLRGLDTFRGFALMIMIFVNYGGKYLFFCFLLHIFFLS